MPTITMPDTVNGRAWGCNLCGKTLMNLDAFNGKNNDNIMMCVFFEKQFKARMNEVKSQEFVNH